MTRYEEVRELVKNDALRIKDIAQQTGYDKGHVSRLRKASRIDKLIADAVAAVSLPVIGIHMSNIFNRETERRTDLLLGNCRGHIIGFGMHGYEMAARQLIHMHSEKG